jgi:hypothetical protein
MWRFLMTESALEYLYNLGTLKILRYFPASHHVRSGQVSLRVKVSVMQLGSKS